jgi:hypothetical protein
MSSRQRVGIVVFGRTCVTIDQSSLIGYIPAPRRSGLLQTRGFSMLWKRFLDQNPYLGGSGGCDI